MVTLAACGSDDSSSSLPDRDASESLAAILASSDKLADAGSAHMVMRLDIEGDQAATVVLDGAFDVAAKAAVFDVKVGGDGMAGGGLSLAIRVVGNAIYIDGSDLGLAQLFGGAGIDPDAKWLKLDLSGAGAGSSESGALGALDSDPSAILDALQGVGDVQDKGSEKVRGVETTHYRVLIDPASAAGGLPADQQAQLSDLLTQLSDEPIPADVWIDADGLLRKMKLSVDAEGSGSMTMTFELFDFGEKVSVETPPASDTTDLTSAFTSLFSGSGGLGGLLPGLEGFGGLGGAS